MGKWCYYSSTIIREMTEPSMQLWADDTNNELAIFLSSKYVIRTNQSANYTKVIDESPCMEGYTYDWKHTLSHWVNYHFGNQVTVNFANASTVDNPKSEFVDVQILKYFLEEERRDHEKFWHSTS
jgi:hypothetical protein